MTYLTQWLNLYMIHFSAIVAILMLIDIYVKGLPSIQDLKDKAKVVFLIALIVAVFSSHAHTHTILMLAKEIK